MENKKQERDIVTLFPMTGEVKRAVVVVTRRHRALVKKVMTTMATTEYCARATQRHRSGFVPEN